MKRLILSALALSMLAVPTAYAGDYRGQRSEYRTVQKFHGPTRDVRRVDKKIVVRRGDKVVVRKVERTRWIKGHRVADWQRRDVVRDYKRYGLRRPGHGQQWVRVDNSYLLIGISTGIIAAN